MNCIYLKTELMLLCNIINAFTLNKVTESLRNNIHETHTKLKLK